MTHEYLIFTEENGTYKIGTDNFTNRNALKKSVKDIVIPNYYLGIPVTIIGMYSFNYDSTIESVFIPSNILEIRYDAFAHNPNLKSFVFARNSTLKTIGRGFVYDCRKLKKIILPKTLESIGLYFIGNSLLDDVYICGFNELTEPTMFESDSGTMTYPRRVHVSIDYGYSSLGKFTNLLRDYKCEALNFFISKNCRPIGPRNFIFFVVSTIFS